MILNNEPAGGQGQEYREQEEEKEKAARVEELEKETIGKLPNSL